MALLLFFFVSTEMWAKEELITFTGFHATAGSLGIGQDSTEGYDKLVDGKFGSTDEKDWSKWCTQSKSLKENNVNYYYVDFNYTTVINVEKYIMTTGNDNETSGCENRNPKSWVLKAKVNANDAWTTIATVTNDQTMEDKNCTDYTFDVDKIGAFRYFRFMVSETQGGDCLQLSELRLQGTYIPIHEIENIDDWNNFAANINKGADFTYYKLIKNISGVTTTVGTKEHPFCGIFDGNGKTLTLSINSTKENAAPFSVVNGATISNVTIDGSIVSTNKFAGGLVGIAYGTTYITDCTNSVEIISDIDMEINKKDGDATYGGFVGRNMENGTIRFDNCTFNGTIREVDPENPKTIKCAGFVGWRAGTISYTNCLQAGSIAVKGTTATFHRGGDSKTTFVNTYYLKASGDEQGTQAETSLPDGNIVKKYSVGKTDYYLSAATVSGLEQTSFAYTTRLIDLSPVVTCNNTTLAKDTDYVIRIEKKMDKGYEEVKEIRDAGEYHLTISGIGDYAGSHVTTVSVVALGGSWADLQEALDNNSYVCLTQDYKAEEKDVVLSVNKTVTLDLNGHTIHRGLKEAVADGNVISIGTGGRLTVIDSSDKKDGCITGGKNKGNGGGIINKGTLTIENGIISGNVCEAAGGTVYGTGGGIYNEGYKSYFYMKGGFIMDNYARGGGAGIHAKSAKLLCITGGEITGNTTPTKGGGVRLSDTEGTISDCIIAKNTTTDEKEARGGAIYVEGKPLTLSNCLITGNSAKVEGGAVFVMKKGKVVANNCTITNNESKKGGCFSLLEGVYALNGGVYSGNTSTNKSNSVFNVESKAAFDLYLSSSAPNSLTDLNLCTPNSVTLAGRTLWKDGDWNTLCLPFSLTEEQLANSALAGATIMQLDVTDSSTNLDKNGRLNLNFKKSAGIEAGKPYLIKWAVGENLTETNLVFSDVTIHSSVNNDMSTDGKVTFMGTYDPITFTTEDKSILFLGTENKLYYPDGKAATTIGACCAYFKIGGDNKLKDVEDGDVDARAIIGFDLNFDEGTTGIVDMNCDKVTDHHWYTLSGIQLSEAPAGQGVYIHRGRKIEKK